MKNFLFILLVLLSAATSCFAETFGHAVIGGSYDLEIDAGDAELEKFTLSEGGTLISVSNYIRSQSGTAKIKCLIYDDNGPGGTPGTRLGISPEQNISTTAQWYTADFSAGIELIAGDYWIGLCVSDHAVVFYYDSSPAVDWEYHAGFNYSSPPATWPGESFNGGGAVGSRYVTYTPDNPPVPPAEPIYLSPQDNAQGQSINTDLTWQDNGDADSYNVYFGTTNPPPLQGNQLPTTFDPGTLNYSTTYYWQVEAVNSAGTTAGPLWSFTTESLPLPLPATNPDPADAATGQLISGSTLRWQDEGGATSFLIFFGTTAALGPAEYMGEQTSTVYNLPELAYGQTYYWRIDSRNISGVTTGTLWSFTTEILPPWPFFDDFQRPDSSDIGNAWLEKGIYFSLSNNEVIKNSGGTERDNIVYRPAVEDIADVEACVEFRVTDLEAMGRPQLHLRVQADTAAVPGQLHSYQLYILTPDSIGLNRCDAAGTTTLVSPVPIIPQLNLTDRYRLRFNAKGTTVVNLNGYVERWNGTDWEVTGLVRTDDMDAQRKGAGSVGFSLDNNSGIVYDNLSIDTFSGEGMQPDPSKPSIICLGDSITEGEGDDLWFSYRDHLQQLLGVSNYNFIGAWRSPFSSDAYFVEHCGVGGQTTAQIEGRLQEHLDEFFPTVVPVGSAVLIHAGTNDVSSYISITDIVQNIEDMVTMIDTHNPDIDVHVALIIPRDDGRDSTNNDFNAALRTMLEDFQQNKDNLYIVDMNTAFIDNPNWIADYMSDYLHPNDSGYQVMAGEWAKSVKRAAPKPNLMCLGDSITRGYLDVPVEFGYRDHLQEYLGLYSYDFVGPYSNPDSDAVYSVWHAGINGNETWEIENRLQAHLDDYFPAGILPGSTILLHAGTNDISHNIGGGINSAILSAVENVEDMIDMINAHNSAINVYVAIIIPQTDPVNDAYTDIYNGQLLNMLLDYQTRKSNLYIVDMNTPFKANPDWATDYMVDREHCTDTGYDVMAVQWADHLRPLPATDPYPMDGAIDTMRDIQLSWQDGGRTDSFDIYFGTDENPGSAEYHGNQTQTTFNPGLLQYNTMYYWRIDAVNISGTTTGQVWSFTTVEAPSSQAKNPHPVDGAINVPLDTLTSWDIVPEANSYDVYFGTGNPPPFIHNQTANSYQPTAGLNTNTTYYWRIDTITSTGTTQGQLWSFSTIPEPPLAPQYISPADLAAGQDIETDLVWIPQSDADNYNIYFGVADPPPLVVSGHLTPRYDPGTLTYNTRYFWKIEAVNAGGSTQGALWSFTTHIAPPEQADNPVPIDYAVSQDINIDLSWDVVPSADSYDIYFGKTKALSAADFKANQTQALFDPGVLEYSTTYYWRIDTVNAGGITTGEVWQFTTQVGLYDTFELQVTNDNTYANPFDFAEIELQAVFTSPSGRILNVFGFYDGDGEGGQNGNVWKLRFMPDEQGQWTYQYSWTDATAGGTGSFVVGEKTLPKIHGHVHIDSGHPHYLIHDDGTAHYWWGANWLDNYAPEYVHGQPWPNYVSDQQYLDHLDTVEQYNHNGLLIKVALFPLEDDKVTWNIAWLRRAEFLVQEMAKRGIYAQINFFDTWARGAGTWEAQTEGTLQVFNVWVSGDEDAKKNYIKTIIARFAGFANVYWELGNEMDHEPNSGQDFISQANSNYIPWLQQYDPYNLPIGVSFADTHMWQTINVDIGFVHQTDEIPLISWTKPVIMNELVRGGIEGYLWEDTAIRNSANRIAYRRTFWRMFTYGGCGSSECSWLDYITPLNQAAIDVMADQQRLREFMEALPVSVNEMSSLNSFVASGPGTDSTRRKADAVYVTYFLLNPDQSRNAGTVRVNLAAGDYEAKWYDPKTGTYTAPISVISSGGSVSIARPAFSEDIVLLITNPPPQASAPLPAHLSSGVNINTDLNWQAIAQANSYDIYFGTATPPLFAANINTNSYDPGTLAHNTTYYWRVDVISDGGTTQGQVWSFTTNIAPPQQAYNPVPADKSIDRSVTPSLSWQAEADADSFDIYFGAVNPPLFIINTTQASYDPGPLSNETTYYWRIDTVNSSGTTTGNTWEFTTVIAGPAPIQNFVPADGEVNQPLDVQLSWDASARADYYHVYFGASPDPTQAATTPDTTYDPGTLDYDTIYYWRVEAVNSAGVTSSNEQSFTTVVPAPSPPVYISPLENAQDESINSELIWNTAAYAQSYDIYLGTTDPPSLVGQDITETTYDPGTLDYDTIYYWRVDAKNSSGAGQGPVWQFTTQIRPPAQASNPVPINGAANQIPELTLSWFAQPDADSFDVYFGNTNPPPFIGNQAGNEYTLNSLEYDTTYYWRIDSVNTTGTTTGQVWSFSTINAPPEPVTSPVPAHESTGQDINTDISWSAAQGAESYEVYFGRSSPPSFAAAQTGTTFDPGILEYNTAYYWRVDSVNASGTTQGAQWSFTVVDSPVAGSPPITPRWMFEHGVWEDNTNTRASTEALVNGYNMRNIPVGFVIIDSPWAEHYNNFIWDTARYPNPQEMIDTFHAAGIKVILWFCGFVNTDNPDYGFVKTQGYAVNNGEDFTWWKGTGVHIDFTNPQARQWWNSKLDNMHAMGIDGWKVDMSADHLDDTLLTSIGEISKEEFKPYYYASQFDCTTAAGTEHGIITRPYSWQGGYGAPVSKVSIGWCGDNDGNWSGLTQQIDNIFTSAAAGYGAVGSEVGGYWHVDPAKNVLIRWAQLGALMPLMENGGTNGGEEEHLPWYHDQETVDIYQYFATLHTELIPYLFSCGVEANLTGTSIIRNIDQDNKQYTLGEEIFVSAITSDTASRTVSFPAGSDWIDYWNQDTVYSGGSTVSYYAPLSAYPVFIKQGAIIPLNVTNDITGNGDATSAGKQTVLIYPNNDSAFLFHKPVADGIEYEDVTITMSQAQSLITVDGAGIDAYRFRVQWPQSPDVVQGADQWSYDEVNGVVIIDKTGDNFQISLVDLPSPPQAANPDPANGAQDQATDIQLSWDEVTQADSYDIYFGTTNPPQFIANTAQNFYGPAALLNDTTYYWRVDTISLGGTTEGNVWSFTTAIAPPSVPQYISPIDTALDQPVDASLIWMSQAGADTYKVFFGTTNPPPLLEPLYTQASYTPGTLEYDTTYYWQIEAVNSGGSASGAIWSFTTVISPPQPAVYISPADNAQNEPVDVDIVWSDGGYAQYYDVYFGTTNPPPLVESNTGNTSYDPRRLSFETTYYWQVDARNSSGTAQGQVWQFTTTLPAPSVVTNPVPAHAAIDHSTTADLSWSYIGSAATYKVYFGAAFPPPHVADTAAAVYDPGTLNYSTMYYWRVDTTNAAGTTQGPDWYFTTLEEPVPPNKAINPDYADGAEDVPLTGTLSWEDGGFSDSFDVYFGTDELALSFMGNQAALFFDTGALEYETTYYWRIDSVNQYAVTTGDTWSFTTWPESLIVSVVPASYEVYEDLKAGDAYYIDTNFTITGLPDALGQSTWIKTAQSDWPQTADEFLHFRLTQDAYVYVHYDAQASSLPDWLGTFFYTGFSLKTTDKDLRSYVRFYQEGDIILGANLSQGAAGAASNYTVCAKEDGNLPLMTSLQPTGYELVFGLGNGDEYYIDRTYTLTGIPVQLDEALWIKTANDDKNNTASSLINFTLTREANVYVAYDSRASTLPNWMNGFTDSGVTIRTTDVTLIVYEKLYPAGPVVLGGNMASGAGGARSNYIVCAKEPGPPPFVTLTQPADYQLTQGISAGDTYYIDRTYTLTSVPTQLDAAYWIKTANDDKNLTGNSVIEFTLSNDALVYVAYDSRATSLPAWLEGVFSPAGMVLTTTDVQLNIYSASYAAGTIILGGNAVSPAAGMSSNYIVIIQE